MFYVNVVNHSTEFAIAFQELYAVLHTPSTSDNMDWPRNLTRDECIRASTLMEEGRNMNYVADVLLYFIPRLLEL